MLIQNNNIHPIDYLQDWPTHYYEITSGSMRKEILTTAIEKSLDPAEDSYRMQLCEKRFYSYSTDGTVDAFSRAFTMILASSASGVSFLTKKRQLQELKDYMADLCLIHWKTENNLQVQLLQAEWKDFAQSFIRSCVQSKAYCSTLFGVVPIKDASVAEKLALQIDLVTRSYPALFALDETFLPLRNIFKDSYCCMLEQGTKYWDSFIK